ncbi:MAG TPA: GNAT family N-acetyltransferase [Pyrinomonadaceae bacterium]|nr:GNAT family N-acetyltransferase [Pyrinomonadaceae bacterium]
MTFSLRTANADDVDQIAKLVAESVRGLAKGIYDERQIELSIKSVFGVDHQLIADRTYFVAESENGIVGCGGWSKRKTLYGSSAYRDSRDPELLDPALDAAKIRAFFVHPNAARQGIGRAILERCESEAKAAGFLFAEMMATLPGVPLYAACGYEEGERIGVPVGEGVEIVCIRMRKELS